MAYTGAPDSALVSSMAGQPATLSHSHSQSQLQYLVSQPLAPTSMHYAAGSLMGGRLMGSDGVSSSPAVSVSMSTMASPAQYQLGAPMFGTAAPAPAQLWMGDIEAWMDEECICQIWARMGEIVSVKMIRDRLTGGPANYCFIELSAAADAERMLAMYNGKPMPLPFDRPFRLNWASGAPVGAQFSSAIPAPAYTGQGTSLLGGPQDGGANSAALQPADGDGSEYSLFVGDLAPEVTDLQLAHEFRCRYASARTAKVVTDAITMLPRGYGFVRFSDEADRQQALVEMQGHIIGSRAIRVSVATPKRTPTMGSSHSHQHSHYTENGGRDATRSPALSDSSADSAASYNPATDPFNTTVFVGGLMNPVGEDELHDFFSVYGEVGYCKIPLNRGCGFVTFAKRANAEAAMRALNGHVLGGSRVRLSWGRSQSHARHNYRNRHSTRHHASFHNSGSNNSGNASGANSHRNSISEQHGLYSRRSVSFGKTPAPAVQPAALGLGLSGAQVPGAQIPGTVPSAARGVPAGQHQPHGLGGMDTANTQALPGLLGGGYLGGGIPYGQSHLQPQQQYYLQQQNHHPHPYQQAPPQLGEHMVPHSAFYTISPAHAVAGMDAFGSASVTPLMNQALGYYHPQPQPQPNASQFDAINTVPGLAGASDLLTRRLSALTLNGGSNGSNNTSANAQPPALDRRASAGVIGQRRLSTKPSFTQPPSLQPQKAASQLSLSQLWPQTPTLGDLCTNHLTQISDYPGALSTPASSARLSTSSLSLLALQPAPDTHDSARASLDEQHSRRRDQLDFELSGAI
ncbi:hypothetical protein IW148_001622 [Coemansia sp. RSA 1199]|nr:hypothetical protein IW148_001622 [Coemansia sp. RSA 1199]